MGRVMNNVCGVCSRKRFMPQYAVLNLKQSAVSAESTNTAVLFAESVRSGSMVLIRIYVLGSDVHALPLSAAI